MMKKVLSIFLSISLIIGSFFTISISALAASNPYPTRQDVDNDGYYEVPCTYIAWQQVYENLGIALPAWSHGGTWLDYAKKAGYSTGTTAKPKSLAVWQGSEYGHVAYVKSVSGSTMTVAEGGRTDLDQTSSHGIDYGFDTSAIVGSTRYGGIRLAGFIYLESASNTIGAATNLKATRNGTSITVTWNKASGANCYDIIVTYPNGKVDYLHTTGESKTIMNCVPGTYKFDVQSLYRPNGSTTGQIIGPHSGTITHYFALTAPTNVKVTDDGKNINVSWAAVTGASCYDVIVAKPDGTTDYLHSHSTSRMIQNYAGGTYKIKVQAIFRVNEAREGQIVSPHSNIVTYAFTRKTDISACSIKLSNDVYVYNGKAKKPSVTVTDSNGKKLVNKTDYTVQYQKEGRTKVGKYPVQITGKGNYSGKTVVYFIIRPQPTTVKSLTGRSKGLTVKLNKQATQTTGYQVQYSTSSTFADAKTINVVKNTTTSIKVNKLQKSKKYYVRVRTYKTVDNKRYYSTWSKAKSVKTK